MVTRVTKDLLKSLALVEAGVELPVEEFRGRKEPLARLIYGILIHRAQPEAAKDIFSGVTSELSGECEQKARVYLAICYSYTGEYSEGLAIVNDVLSEPLADFVHFQALLAKAALTISSPKKALEILALAENYAQGVTLALKGKLHNQRARALKELKRYDEASVEYAGAAGLFDEAGNQGCAAMASNNLAGVFLKWRKYLEAHEAVDRAIEIAIDVRDPLLPNFQDQKAQILVAEGKSKEAKQLIDRVITSVGQGDKKELLCECFITRARAYAGLDLYVEAFQDLDRAQGISEYLSRPDLSFNVLKARKEIAEEVSVNSHVRAVTLALDLSRGSFREAAARLGVSHPALIRFVNYHKIDRKPRRSTFGISRQK